MVGHLPAGLITGRKFAFVAIVAVWLAASFASSCRPERGNVGTFRELPEFGAALPATGDTPIAYSYDRRAERLLTKTRSTTSTFFAVCAEMALQITQYEQGFPGSDLVIDDPRFEPEGSRVWCGYGRLRSSGRAQVRVFFEPMDSGGGTNAWGVMYLHVH